jgi:hypothetical protein
MDQFINNIGHQELLHQPNAIDTLISMMLTCTPVLAPNQVPIYRVERGGEVTFHGPGQLVVYPLLDLKRPPYQSDLHWYVRNIEQVIIQCLAHYNIESSRDPDHTGKLRKEPTAPSNLSDKAGFFICIVYTKSLILATTLLVSLFYLQESGLESTRLRQSECRLLSG